MSNQPNNEASPEGRRLLGRARLGLDPLTATMDDCMEGMKFVTEGHVWIGVHEGRYSIIGRLIDGAPTDEAYTIGLIIDDAFTDPALSELPRCERLAKVINRIAGLFDAHIPVEPGDLSRMQALAAMQAVDRGPSV